MECMVLFSALFANLKKGLLVTLTANMYIVATNGMNPVS